jgi:hypothetical protein
MEFRARSVLAAAVACAVLAGCGSPRSGTSLLPATGSGQALATPGRIASPEAGPPAFETGQTIKVFRDPANVAVADLDGDGRPDLTTCSETEPLIAVLFGNGDGTFGTAPFVHVRQACTFVLAEDLNGDGTVDLATSNRDGTAAVLLGHRDGTFDKPVSYPVKDKLKNAAAWWLTTADLNGDGQPDLVVAVHDARRPDETAAGHLAVLLNKGRGTFADAVFYQDRAAAAAVAGDFDGDAELDIATASLDGTVRFFRGSGTGRLGPARESVGGRGVAILAGDLNGDRALDVVTGNDASSSVSVLPGLGDGTFGHAAQFAAGDTRTIALADLDGDGRLDLLAGGSDETLVRLWRGRGDGTFLEPERIDTAGATVRGMAVGDLNRDGRPDLVVTDAHSSVHVFLGR